MIAVEISQVYTMQLTHDEVVALAKMLFPAWKELQAKDYTNTLSEEEGTTLVNLMSIVEKLPDLLEEGVADA